MFWAFFYAVLAAGGDSAQAVVGAEGSFSITVHHHGGQQLFKKQRRQYQRQVGGQDVGLLGLNASNTSNETRNSTTLHKPSRGNRFAFVIFGTFAILFANMLLLHGIWHRNFALNGNRSVRRSNKTDADANVGLLSILVAVCCAPVGCAAFVWPIDPGNLVGGAVKVKDGEATKEEDASGVECPDNAIFKLLRSFAFMDDLFRAFGHRILVLLFFSQHLVKGMVGSFLSGPTQQFLLKSYKVAGPQLQVFMGVTQLPWALKPMIGLVSDAFPIMGYNKGPYILISSFVGASACMAIAGVPHESISVESVVLCLFLVQFQLSSCDLLTEAKYAERMRAIPKHGPALMTYVWFGLQAGGLIAIAAVGPILQHFGVKLPFVISILPLTLIILPVARGYLEEARLTKEQAAENRQSLRRQGEACFLCVLMFMGTITLTVLGIYTESVLTNAVAAIVIAVIMLVAFSVVLRPIIAKVNAFFLIQTSLNISIGGASFYFFTDGKASFHDGPNFSMEFYTSVLGVAGSLCSLVGIYAYQRWGSTWKYRRLLFIANIAASALSLLDIVVFTRANKAIGIPDHAFVLGADVLQSIVWQWQWMPGVVILSQLCPQGMEAIMYALLAGCHNLGNTIASNTGALVLQQLGVQPTGAKEEGEQFKHLWIGSLLGTVMPMLTLVLLPYFIPDARQTDVLLGEDAQDAMAGSLWRRWRSRAEDTNASSQVSSQAPEAAGEAAS